ncbi:MAG: hypothetical protein HY329_24045 [Chloroflexi bacterium]|nr:hypothetical protein [Chloroflexota bacterium]
MENRTERELAEYYQNHKDDPELWEEVDAPGPPPQRQNLGVSITVRFTPAEAQELRAAAKRMNLTYSQLVREAVRRLTHQHQLPTRHLRVRYSHPWAEFNTWPTGSQTITASSAPRVAGVR